MHDPNVLIGTLGPFNLWHRDKGGVDGACGWFMRASHGDPKVLEAIQSLYSFDWDRICKLSDGTTSPMGLFDNSPYGWPAMSIHAIALNLFSLAAWEHFGHDRKSRDAFMRDHLYDILFFAENPVDSMHTGWLHRYGIDERESREDRIRKAAVMVYGCLLRWTRPWYKHPRWHVAHWRLTYDSCYFARLLTRGAR